MLRCTHSCFLVEVKDDGCLQDSFFGYYSGSQDYFQHTDRDANNTIAFDLHLDEGSRCGKDCSQPQLHLKGNYSAGLFAQRALAILDEHAQEWLAHPLFIYAAFQSVHCPIQVPQKYVAPYLHLDPNRQQFAGMLAALDEAIGTVVDGFQSRGFWTNTLTVFTTDNGGPVGSIVDPKTGIPTPHGIGCATGSQNTPL